jgi:hypothetical protein
MTYSSDVYICFSALLEEVSCFKFTKELTELKEADLGLLKEPSEEAVARGMKSPNTGSVLTRKHFAM